MRSDPKRVPKSGFMVSPLYDGILFIGAPFIALAGALVIMGGVPWAMRPATLFGTNEAWLSLLISVWTYAHLCAVVFRSHVNRDMYTRFKIRFTVVPLVLFLGLMFSDWLLVTGIVVAVFWDVYHTAMQNFGFCRIYDARQGSFSDKGRKLDIMVNQLLYIGPIVGGLSLAPTLVVVEQYIGLGWFFPIEAANFLVFIQPRLAPLLLVGGTLFLAYYVFSYWQLARQGYRVSRQKVTILFSTGITSVWAWGRLSTRSSCRTFITRYSISGSCGPWRNATSGAPSGLPGSRVAPGSRLLCFCCPCWPPVSLSNITAPTRFAGGWPFLPSSP